MIAAVAATLGSGRRYHLFDSFAGLPPPDALDGERMFDGRLVAKWARPGRFATDSQPARDAMRMAGATDYVVYEGWLNDTLGLAPFDAGIAFLRIDTDLYAPTFGCLTALFDRVNPGGVVVIDDYVWLPGVGRAVTDWLAATGRADPVQRLDTGTGTPVEAVWYLRKGEG